MFSMNESKYIQSMFGWFYTIPNEFKIHGKTYDNYDHIDKILRILARQWRPQVIALTTRRKARKALCQPGRIWTTHL